MVVTPCVRVLRPLLTLIPHFSTKPLTHLLVPSPPAGAGAQPAGGRAHRHRRHAAVPRRGLAQGHQLLDQGEW